MRVSVVIPAYNVEDLIPQAIESLLAQTVPPHEIIVVDDGSTDGTWRAVRRYHPQVRYLYQDNAGPSVARNTGIEAATGDWVAFLDSDDIWLSNKIEAERRVLEESPDLVWVATNHHLCVFGTEERFLRFDPGRIPEGLLQSSALESFVQAAAAGLGWDPLGLLVRRDVLSRAGGFRPGLDYGEDLDLCLTIAREHPRIGFWPEPVAVHYIDRPEGLCKKQPIFKQMKTLRGILDRHLPHAFATGTAQHLQTVFRTIVQDRLAILLSEGRRVEMAKVYFAFPDLLAAKYFLSLAAIGCFPKGFRKKLYTRLQWKIRG